MENSRTNTINRIVEKLYRVEISGVLILNKKEYEEDRLNRRSIINYGISNRIRYIEKHHINILGGRNKIDMILEYGVWIKDSISGESVFIDYEFLSDKVLNRINSIMDLLID